MKIFILVIILIGLLFVANRTLYKLDKNEYNALKLTERAMLQHFQDGSWSKDNKLHIQLYTLNVIKLDKHKDRKYYSKNLYPNH